MNKHILIAMDWKNRSLEELKENYSAAWDAADAAAAAADAADAAADAAAADVLWAADVVAEHWLNKYFKLTGENREEYEKALKDMKK